MSERSRIATGAEIVGIIGGLLGIFAFAISITQSEREIPRQTADAFFKTYYKAAPKDPHSTYLHMTTQAFKSTEAGEQPAYDNFWGSVRSAAPYDVVRFGSSASTFRLRVELAYKKKGTEVVPATVLQLECDSWFHRHVFGNCDASDIRIDDSIPKSALATTSP